MTRIGSIMNNLNETIKIKKSSCADIRTCDWSKVTEQELLDNSKMHIEDVKKALTFLLLNY